MNYIKNNKIFILLFSILCIIISFLGYLIIDGKKPEEIIKPVDKEEIDTYIQFFEGSFNEKEMVVDLQFEIKEIEKLVVKNEIWYNNKKLVEVKNGNAISLPLSEYGFITGENRFDLKVFLDDNSVLEKTVYVYMDEAFQIEVKEINENNKIIYNIEYWYDSRNIVSVPSMSILNTNLPVDIRYISAHEMTRKGQYIKMNCVYELDYSQVEAGKHKIELFWSFPSLDVRKDHTSTFTKGE